MDGVRYAHARVSICPCMSRSLNVLKAEILAELQKYKPKARLAALTHSRGEKVHKGGLDLRHTVDQIAQLLEELDGYRPSLGG